MHASRRDLTPCSRRAIFLSAPWHRSCSYVERVGSADVRQGEGMKTQVNFVERRERPRVGVMAQVEDITYSILRKHGVASELRRKRPTIQPITQ